MSDLAYKRTNVYEVADEKLMKEIFDYAEGYKTFLDEGKTEREVCAYVVKAAEEKGYKPFKFGQKLKAGDKVYYNNRNKNIYLIRVGTEDVAENGIRIIASQHIDRKATLVLALSFSFGLSVELVAEILTQMPETIKNIFSSGITTGGLTAILANALIRIKE